MVHFGAPPPTSNLSRLLPFLRACPSAHAAYIVFNAHTCIESGFVRRHMHVRLR